MRHKKHHCHQSTAIFTALFFFLAFVQKNANAGVSVSMSASITTEVTGSLDITLDGNWENSGTYTPGSSTITLNGTETQTVSNASGSFNNLTVNKASGDVQVASAITVDATLTLTSGDVDLNGNVITLGTSALLVESAGNTVKGASGHIETTRSLGALTNDNVAGLGFEITTAVSLGSTQIIRAHAPQTGNGNSSIERYFDVTPTNNSGLNASVAYRYDDSELGGQTEANLELYKSIDSGASWTSEGGTADGNANTVTQSGIGNFSRWTAADQSLASPALVADAGQDRGLAAGGAVQIGGSPTASGGLAPYTYAWAPTTGLDDAALANPTASPSVTTEYILTVTDGNNQTAMDTLIVTVVNLGDFIVTTANDIVDGNTTSIADLIANQGTDGKISLREAISATNNTTGADTIRFDSSIDGTPIVLDIGATGEDANVDGDLDITDAGGLVLTGNGESNTIIDGNDTERVFDHSNGDLTMTDITIQNGFAPGNFPGRGGGLRSVVASSAALVLSNCTFTGNDTHRGGGLYTEGPLTNATLTGCTFSNNTASSVGGAIKFDLDEFAQEQLISCTFINNRSTVYGGAVSHGSNRGTLEINGCIFTNNQSDNSAGALDAAAIDAIYIIENSTFAGNSTVGDGGAMRIQNSSQGSMHINNSTISGNTADRDGGGIDFSSSGSPLTIVNSTISGNEAKRHGGGISHDDNNALLHLNFVTITQNIADKDADGTGEGGGIDILRASGTPTVNVHNSIIQGNDDLTSGQTSADDFGNSGGAGTYTTLGGNVFGNGTGNSPGVDDTTDPANLGLLQNNGGTTETHALQTGSAAANFIADCDTVTTDQIGSPRPFGGACDAGAVESNILPSTLVSDAGADKAFCAGGLAQIGGNPTATGGIAPYSYNWSPSTGLDDATIANPTASPSVTTEYIVTMTDANNQTAMDTVIVTVNPNPVADAGADQSIAPGGNVQIGGSPTADGGTPGYTYSWSPTIGLDDETAPNPNASPASTTTYIVTVTDSKGCTAQDDVIVTVEQPKDFIFLAQDEIIIERSKESGSFGDIHSNGNLIIEKGDPSTYTTNLTAVGDIEINKDITIDGDVTAGGSIDNDGTITGAVNANASVAVVNLPAKSFSAGGANHSVGKEQTLTLAPGSYGNVTLGKLSTLKLTSGDYYFTNLLANNREIVFDFDLSSGNPLNINVTSELQFGREVEIHTTNGDDDSRLITFCTLQSQAITIGKEALFIGTLIAPNAKVTFVKNSRIRGCVCAKVIEIERDCLWFYHDGTGGGGTPTPVADAGADETILPGGSVEIGGSPTASGGTSPYSYSWTPTTGLDDATIANPIASPATTTTYTVVVTDANSQTAQDEMTVTVDANIVADAGADQVISPGDMVEIGGSPTASGGTSPYTYSWTPTTGLDDATISNPIASPANTTVYTVIVTDEDGFTGQDEVTVTVNQPQAAKSFVFLAEDEITIEGSEEGGAFGDMHSNGDLTIEKGDPNQYITNLSAVGEITIEKKNTIDGDVTAGGSIDNDGTVTGTINANTSVAVISLPSKNFSTGGSNHNVGSNQILTLTPGSYSNVSLDEGSTLKLSSGEYFFNTLNLEEREIIVDFDLSNGNPVTVNVKTELLFGRELEIRSTNGDADSDLITFCTLQSQRIKIGKEAFFYGSLIAVNAKVTLVKNSQLRGAICAKEIVIDSDCIWLHHDAPGSLPGVGALSKFIAVDNDDVNEASAPTSFALEQNYPNPFNPTTRIAFALPQAAKVTLEIYNILGYKVRTFALGSLNAGFHNVQWDGRNESGRQVVSGVYIYKLQAGEHQEVKRMLLMK